MKAVLIAALLAAGPALADDMVVSDSRVDITVRLTEKPCARPELALALVLVNPAPAKAAAIRFHGDDRVGCWVTDPDDPEVMVIDEKGGGAVLQLQIFRREPGI